MSSQMSFGERLKLVGEILQQFDKLIHILIVNGSKAKTFYSFHYDKFKSLVKALEHAHANEINEMFENLIRAGLQTVADKTKNCIDLHIRTFCEVIIELAKCVNTINLEQLAKTLLESEKDIYRGLINIIEEAIEDTRFEIVHLRILLNDLEDKIKQLKSIVNQLESR